jgi:hypothetical protein
MTQSQIAEANKLDAQKPSAHCSVAISPQAHFQPQLLGVAPPTHREKADQADPN